jgi:hypothetical protein
MSRLIVNPGTPQAWEIQLRPGANSLGRNDANDFQINDPSVSGSHCQILVNDRSVVLKDIGSTNGTFVDGARVQERPLEHGKDIRLGSVGMIFYSETDALVAAIESTPPPAPAVRVVVRIATPVVAEAVEAPPVESETMVSDPAIFMGTRFCKHHVKSPARFLCQKCDRSYCDLCVNSMDVGGVSVRKCRVCGTQAVPYQFWQPPEKGFYAKLPAAFVYPFKGAGIVVLVFATIAFSALSFISHGLLGIFISMALYGFVFLFMQNIILTTTSDEKESLSFPDMSSLFGAFFQFAGTVLASFWLALGLSIAKLSDVDIPSEAIIASVILGGVYFPMALLVVAMKDTALAANPLVVIPAMLKVPGKYAVTVVLMLGVFGVRQLGNMFSGGVGHAALRTRSVNTFMEMAGIQMVWALLSVYLLVVTMRILGLFYNASKQKLGWFTH